MKRDIINSWKQLSLQQFADLMSIQAGETDAEERSRKIIMCLYGVDPLEIPYTEYLAMVHGLNSFFDEPITSEKVSANAEYKINGMVYVLDIAPANFTTAQYIDFTNYSKRESYVDMLSVVLIPQGHQYNDGYDMAKVKDDLGAMPVTEAVGIVHFFATWSKASIKTILRFLTSRKMTKGMETEKRKALKGEVRRLSRIMASFPSSLRTASWRTRL